MDSSMFFTSGFEKKHTWTPPLIHNLERVRIWISIHEIFQFKLTLGGRRVKRIHFFVFAEFDKKRHIFSC
jgi:hypothetical protein